MTKFARAAWKRCVERLSPASPAVGRFQVAPDNYLPSIDGGKVTEKRLSVLRDVRAYCSARKSLQGDELAFKQRTKFFPISNVIGRVLDQHQCCEFMGTQHGMLLMQRETPVVRFCGDGRCMTPTTVG